MKRIFITIALVLIVLGIGSALVFYSSSWGSTITSALTIEDEKKITGEKEAEEAVGNISAQIEEVSGQLESIEEELE